MKRRNRLNLLNILYYYVQRCIASSNNNNLDSKSHLSTEIVVANMFASAFKKKTSFCKIVKHMWPKIFKLKKNTLSSWVAL